MTAKAVATTTAFPAEAGPGKKEGESPGGSPVLFLIPHPSSPGHIRGTNMMWAFGVPGNISQGALGAGCAGMPVDSGVAYGM